LQIEEDKAKFVGFERPIIHGLCSAGYSARAIYEKYCNGDSDKIKTFSTRFTSHVYPGETYQVELWKRNNTVIFQTKTKERGIVALKGYAEL
jgi:peroxisomal enoyl-CoA hydratase 2